MRPVPAARTSSAFARMAGHFHRPSRGRPFDAVQAMLHCHRARLSFFMAGLAAGHKTRRILRWGGSSLQPHFPVAGGRTLNLENVARELLTATNASRVTVRLALHGENFPVVAEAVAAGVGTIRSDVWPDLGSASTVKYLAEHRTNLIQDDCQTAEVRPPDQLMDSYRVKAQMLGPILLRGQLAGIVSVHYIPNLRHWTRDEVLALERAVGAVELALVGEGS